MLPARDVAEPLGIPVEDLCSVNCGEGYACEKAQRLDMRHVRVARTGD